MLKQLAIHTQIHRHTHIHEKATADYNLQLPRAHLPGCLRNIYGLYELQVKETTSVLIYTTSDIFVTSHVTVRKYAQGFRAVPLT